MLGKTFSFANKGWDLDAKIQSWSILPSPVMGKHLVTTDLLPYARDRYLLHLRGRRNWLGNLRVSGSSVLGVFCLVIVWFFLDFFGNLVG